MVQQDVKIRDPAMPQDTEKTIRELAARLWGFPIEEYLSSENFSLFCREYDLGDAWREYLELSRDIPELYGSTVIKNAFVLFLHHIFHSRPKEFPALFLSLLMDFSRGISCVLPLDELKADLVLLGYPDQEIEHEFSRVNADGKDTPESRDDMLS
jgi:hypothetical protein